MAEERLDYTHALYGGLFINRNAQFLLPLTYKNLFQKYIAATEGGYKNVRVARKAPRWQRATFKLLTSIRISHLANPFKKGCFFVRQIPHRAPPVNTKNA
jgi:hypothetical protein